MRYRPSKEAFDVEAVALRFMLWRQADAEWLEAPLDEKREEPPCPVTDDDLPALVDGLVALVIGARQVIARRQLAITDPDQMAHFIHEQLQSELEAMERESRRARLQPVPDPGDPDAVRK